MREVMLKWRTLELTQVLWWEGCLQGSQYGAQIVFATLPFNVASGLGGSTLFLPSPRWRPGNLHRSGG